MSLNNTQVGSEAISALLRGAQLDTIRVYSLIIQLGFIRTGIAEDIPHEIWISVSGDLIVEESLTIGEVELAGEFFRRRAQVLSATYLLIGEKVTSACVLKSGAMQIGFEGKKLRAEAHGSDNLEEVWAVMSDTPDAIADHRWYVSLDDSGTVSTRIPA